MLPNQMPKHRRKRPIRNQKEDDTKTKNRSFHYPERLPFVRKKFFERLIKIDRKNALENELELKRMAMQKAQKAATEALGLAVFTNTLYYKITTPLLNDQQFRELVKIQTDAVLKQDKLNGAMMSNAENKDAAYEASSEKVPTKESQKSFASSEENPLNQCKNSGKQEKVGEKAIANSSINTDASNTKPACSTPQKNHIVTPTAITNDQPCPNVAKQTDANIVQAVLKQKEIDGVKMNKAKNKDGEYVASSKKIPAKKPWKSLASSEENPLHQIKHAGKQNKVGEQEIDASIQKTANIAITKPAFSTLQKHLVSHPLIAKKPDHQCAYCDRKFALLNTLNMHLLQYCMKIPALEHRKLETLKRS